MPYHGIPKTRMKEYIRAVVSIEVKIKIELKLLYLTSKKLISKSLMCISFYMCMKTVLKCNKNKSI